MRPASFSLAQGWVAWGWLSLGDSGRPAFTELLVFAGRLGARRPPRLEGRGSSGGQTRRICEDGRAEHRHIVEPRATVVGVRGRVTGEGRVVHVGLQRTKGAGGWGLQGAGRRAGIPGSPLPEEARRAGPGQLLAGASQLHLSRSRSVGPPCGGHRPVSGGSPGF